MMPFKTLRRATFFEMEMYRKMKVETSKRFNGTNMGCLFWKKLETKLGGTLSIDDKNFLVLRK